MKTQTAQPDSRTRARERQAETAKPFRYKLRELERLMKQRGTLPSEPPSVPLHKMGASRTVQNR